MTSVFFPLMSLPQTVGAPGHFPQSFSATPRINQGIACDGLTSGLMVKLPADHSVFKRFGPLAEPEAQPTLTPLLQRNLNLEHGVDGSVVRCDSSFNFGIDAHHRQNNAGRKQREHEACLKIKSRTSGLADIELTIADTRSSSTVADMSSVKVKSYSVGLDLLPINPGMPTLVYVDRNVMLAREQDSLFDDFDSRDLAEDKVCVVNLQGKQGSCYEGLSLKVVIGFVKNGKTPKKEIIGLQVNGTNPNNGVLWQEEFNEALLRKEKVSPHTFNLQLGSTSFYAVWPFGEKPYLFNVENGSIKIIESPSLSCKHACLLIDDEIVHLERVVDEVGKVSLKQSDDVLLASLDENKEVQIELFANKLISVNTEGALKVWLNDDRVDENLARLVFVSDTSFIIRPSLSKELGKVFQPPVLVELLSDGLVLVRNVSVSAYEALAVNQDQDEDVSVVDFAGTIQTNRKNNNVSVSVMTDDDEYDLEFVSEEFCSLLIGLPKDGVTELDEPLHILLDDKVFHITAIKKDDTRNFDIEGYQTKYDPFKTYHVVAILTTNDDVEEVKQTKDVPVLRGNDFVVYNMNQPESVVALSEATDIVLKVGAKEIGFNVLRTVEGTRLELSNDSNEEWELMTVEGFSQRYVLIDQKGFKYPVYAGKHNLMLKPEVIEGDVASYMIGFVGACEKKDLVFKPQTIMITDTIKIRQGVLKTYFDNQPFQTQIGGEGFTIELQLSMGQDRLQLEGSEVAITTALGIEQYAVKDLGGGRYLLESSKGVKFAVLATAVNVYVYGSQVSAFSDVPRTIVNKWLKDSQAYLVKHNAYLGRAKLDEKRSKIKPMMPIYRLNPDQVIENSKNGQWQDIFYNDGTMIGAFFIEGFVSHLRLWVPGLDHIIYHKLENPVYAQENVVSVCDISKGRSYEAINVMLIFNHGHVFTLPKMKGMSLETGLDAKLFDSMIHHVAKKIRDNDPVLVSEEMIHKIQAGVGPVLDRPPVEDVSEIIQKKEPLLPQGVLLKANAQEIKEWRESAPVGAEKSFTLVSDDGVFMCKIGLMKKENGVEYDVRPSGLVKMQGDDVVDFRYIYIIQDPKERIDFKGEGAILSVMDREARTKYALFFAGNVLILGVDRESLMEIFDEAREKAGRHNTSPKRLDLGAAEVDDAVKRAVLARILGTGALAQR